MNEATTVPRPSITSHEIFNKWPGYKISMEDDLHIEVENPEGTLVWFINIHALCFHLGKNVTTEGIIEKVYPDSYVRMGRYIDPPPKYVVKKWEDVYDELSQKEIMTYWEKYKNHLEVCEL